MRFQETVDAIRSEEASISNLFGDAGTRVADRRRTPEYRKQLVEAARFVAEVESGRRPIHYLKEALTTSDFPILFADILDRQLLANYQELSPVFQNFVRQSTVPDFRNVKRVALDGAEGVLPEVDEREEYPEEPLVESKDEFAVRKYGRRLDLSWEAMVNDDLDAFRRNPERLARAARRSEQKFVTQLYVDANGPHVGLYTLAFGNIVPNNPVLSIEALQTAMITLSEQRDEDGEPILLEMVELVVPPALEVTALNILNATQVESRAAGLGGSDNARLTSANWLKSKFRLSVDPYIPVVATGAGNVGNTCWFLFANPNSGRAAVEFGKLRGYEDPALYERVPNARRIGGGDVLESFDDDSMAWRVRHVFGGTRLTNTGGQKSTVASDGLGGSS